MQYVQLSHDEFLLLLGILRLPVPFAFGEDPTAAYTEEALEVSFVSAMSSLVAREFVRPPLADSPEPNVAPGVAELVSDSALADGCLIVAVEYDDLSSVAYYYWRAGMVIAHTSPADRVHRLERLMAGRVVREQLLTLIAPFDTDADPQPFDADHETLESAIRLASSGHTQDARNTLTGIGAPASAAESLAQQLSGPVRRVNLLSATDMQADQPRVDAVTVLQGTGGTWYVRELPGQPGLVQVRSIGAAAIEAELASLVNRMSPVEASG